MEFHPSKIPIFKTFNVKDENIAYVKSENTDMFANEINYNKDTSLINLIGNVKIIDAYGPNGVSKIIP